MNITSLINMANNDLKYIAGELNFVDDILNTTQDTNSTFVNSIHETLKAYKQNINTIIKRYIDTKKDIKNKAFENICNINTALLPMDDTFLNKVRNYDRQIFNLTRIQLHVYVNWYLEHYDPDHNNYPVIQKVEQLCAQLIDNANTMKISFNTYVVRKHEQGKIK